MDEHQDPSGPSEATSEETVAEPSEETVGETDDEKTQHEKTDDKNTDGVETDGTDPDRPTDTERWLSLETWTLATFDVSLFVLLPLLAGHASGDLGQLLGGLNTLVGIAVFCYLWALFALAVGWVRSQVSLASTSLAWVTLHGVAAGAVVGMAFLLGILAVVVTPDILNGSVEPSGVAFIALLGAAFAAVGGGIVGLFAGLLDVAVYRLAGYAVPGLSSDR